MTGAAGEFAQRRDRSRRIALARVHAGFETITEFAKALDVNTGNAHRWEDPFSGFPGTDAMMEISAITGRSLAYFGGGVDLYRAAAVGEAGWLVEAPADVKRGSTITGPRGEPRFVIARSAPHPDEPHGLPALAVGAPPVVAAAVDEAG